MVALYSLENGGMTDYATGNLHQHESSLFRCLWPQLDPGDIVLGDRAFCSYGSLAMLQAQGNDGVFRLHQKRRIDFREGKRLGADDRLLVWSKPEQRPAGLTPEQYAALPATLEVRMVRLKVAATGFRSQSVTLFTTLTDAETYPAETLRELYGRRWQVEPNGVR